MEETKKIWMNGNFVDWKEANVHILTHTLHYGLGVFEGIRCYETTSGSQIFRLAEHVRRLFDSAHIVRLEIPHSKEEITEAIRETVRINELKSCYIRPIIYLGYGVMGLNPINAPVEAAIAAWPWGTYLGEDGIKNGIRVKVSSFSRHNINSHMNRAKICGAYTNSILAKREAIECGYQEAVLLDSSGFVAEGTGENLFMVRDGAVSTPTACSILPGITRDTIMTILRDENIPIQERLITRDDLYTADEIFLVGTAAEVTPVREVDCRVIGEGTAGPLTKKLQKIYFDLVEGKLSNYNKWLDCI